MLSDSVTIPTVNRANNPIAQAMFMIVSITGNLSLNISSGMPGNSINSNPRIHAGRRRHRILSCRYIMSEGNSFVEGDQKSKPRRMQTPDMEG